MAGEFRGFRGGVKFLGRVAGHAFYILARKGRGKFALVFPVVRTPDEILETIVLRRFPGRWLRLPRMNFAVFRDPRLRELLLWCAPALLVGAVLRLFMEMRMPYGYIQFDTADFLLTPYRLLADHHYVIDSKKAFLTPTFFTIPF